MSQALWKISGIQFAFAAGRNTLDKVQDEEVSVMHILIRKPSHFYSRVRQPINHNPDYFTGGEISSYCRDFQQHSYLDLHHTPKWSPHHFKTDIFSSAWIWSDVFNF